VLARIEATEVVAEAGQVPGHGLGRDADEIAGREPGGTVFVPAGVPHTYQAIDAQYLSVVPRRLDALIS
jgi:hypothetical protein